MKYVILPKLEPPRRYKTIIIHVSDPTNLENVSEN